MALAALAESLDINLKRVYEKAWHYYLLRFGIYSL